MIYENNEPIFSVKTPQIAYKSLGMHLKEQREQIAKEIENVHFYDATGQTPQDVVERIQSHCAPIARGKK